MTERFRALLDEAAEGVTPRAVAPAPAVVRRAVARRRRVTAVTAAVAVVTALALGTAVRVAGWPLATPERDVAASPSPSQKVEVRQRPPLEPEARDGEVRINGFVIPLGEGWQYASYEQAAQYCAITAKTVALVRRGVVPGDCNGRAGIELRDGVSPPFMFIPQRPRPFGLHEVVLPGGQPVWLTDNELDNFRGGAKYGYYAGGFTMPWAGVSVALEMNYRDVLPVLRVMRSEPAPPARLTVPDGMAQVSLQYQGDQATSADPEVIRRVVQRLRELDRLVEPAALPCAGARQLTPDWSLAAQDMAVLMFTNPSATPVRGFRPVSAGVVVGLGTSAECAFATSSDGGRVWLPAGFAAELHALVRGAR